MPIFWSDGEGHIDGCAMRAFVESRVVVDPAHPVLRQIDFVQISNARAFLHIEAAGPPADELREFVADLPCLVIPSLTNAKQFDFLAEYSGEFVEPAHYDVITPVLDRHPELELVGTYPGGPRPSRLYRFRTN